MKTTSSLWPTISFMLLINTIVFNNVTRCAAQSISATFSSNLLATFHWCTCFVGAHEYGVLIAPNICQLDHLTVKKFILSALHLNVNYSIRNSSHL